MGYDPNVPEFPSDSLATTQPEFLDNFKSLYEYFLVNHVPLDDPSDAGNHTLVQLIEQAAPLQTDVGEISVYSQDVFRQTDQVFLRYQGNGQEVQLSNYQIYSLVPTASQTSFFTILPGKIIVYFGTFQNLPNNILQLKPPICTKVIGIATCPTGPLGPSLISGLKSQVKVITQGNNFIKTIQVFSSGNQPSPPSHYIVIGNMR